MIADKSSETLEGMYEDKESTHNENACHKKSASQVVAGL